MTSPPEAGATDGGKRRDSARLDGLAGRLDQGLADARHPLVVNLGGGLDEGPVLLVGQLGDVDPALLDRRQALGLLLADRKSTRLNSSHVRISYAVFCLKKKNNKPDEQTGGQ